MNWLQKIQSTASENPGFLTNLEQKTLDNQDYRRVLFTTKNTQLVLMNVKPGDEIGSEIHQLDQFIRFESGSGKVVLNNFEHEVKDGDAIVVPQGTKHNVINTSKTKPLKLYAIYSPPNHQKNTIHHTKQDEKEEHFDGKTDL